MSRSDISFRETSVSISEIPTDRENSGWGPAEASAYSSKISHDKKGRSPKEIWKSEKEEKGREELDKDIKSFLKRLAKMGHTSCFYQSNVGLNYEVPRHTTLFLCSFDHPKYLQQSQRYTKAKDFISQAEGEVGELYSKQSDLYNRMIEAGVKKEDARYILPLGTAATHIHQNVNFVSIANISRVLKSDNSAVPPLTEKILSRAIDRLNGTAPELFSDELLEVYNENGKGYPVSNMFSKGNRPVRRIRKNFYGDETTVTDFETEIDEELIREGKDLNDEGLSFLNLSNNLENVEGFITSMSISAWHQFMRNDTVKTSVESVYDAAKRGNTVVPKDVKDSDFEREFLNLFNESVEFYRKLKRREGKKTAVEVLPHALDITLAFSLDSFNLLKGFLPDRTQEAAQWEIRKIARKIEHDLKLNNPTD